jgi:hypothetical protein
MVAPWFLNRNLIFLPDTQAAIVVYNTDSLWEMRRQFRGRVLLIQA